MRMSVCCVEVEVEAGVPGVPLVEHPKIMTASYSSGKQRQSIRL